MQIVSRKEAMALGLARYAGSPCRFGHNAERYTNNGYCVECSKAGRARYREKNRKLLAAKAAAYKAANKGQLAVKKSAYRVANKEQIAAYRDKTGERRREADRDRWERKKKGRQLLESIKPKLAKVVSAPVKFGTGFHETMERRREIERAYREKKNAL